MSFTTKELETIAEVQILAKELNKLDNKLKIKKTACDKCSTKYKQASRAIEEGLTLRHDLIQQMGLLKLKLMREMREYEAMPTLSTPVIVANTDQIGRDT